MRFVLAAAAALLASTAMAADVIVSEPAPFEVEPTVARSILLGAGVGVAPKYEGSDEYRVFPFPIFSYDSGTGVDGPRRFEFRGLDDIRLHALRLGGFSAGPLVGYRFGREENDADILAGTGDIDDGFVGGGFVAYDFEVSEAVTLGADLAISTQFTGDPFDTERFVDTIGLDYGYTVDFGVSANLDLTTRANLALRAGAEYADDEYMQTQFGLTSTQSAASIAAGPALAPFDADAGIKNVYINANLAYDVTDSFQIRAGAGYSRLLNDAADSPISVDDNQFSGSLGAAYRFRF